MFDVCTTLDHPVQQVIAVEQIAKNELACLLHHAVNLWKNNGASRNL